MKIKFTLQRYELLEILLPVLRSRMDPEVKLVKIDLVFAEGHWDEDEAILEMDFLTIEGETSGDKAGKVTGTSVDEMAGSLRSEVEG